MTLRHLLLAGQQAITPHIDRLIRRLGDIHLGLAACTLIGIVRSDDGRALLDDISSVDRRGSQAVAVASAVG